MHGSPPGSPPVDWVSVYRAPTRRACEEQALVLKAMDIEHLVTEQPSGCHLLVPAGQSALALEELRLYQRENPRRDVLPWPAIAPVRGLAGAAAFVVFLAACYYVQAGYGFGIDWTITGEFAAGPVLAGQWWRCITALTLHADPAHVAGNIVFGAFFGYLAGQYLGSGIAWLAIVTTAAAGNAANAVLQNAAHRSIGASTAVFAALGLVAAVVWGLSRRYTLGWARRWAPVVGAVALLTYTGTGDAQTDVVAHLTGFGAGLLGGTVLYRLDLPGQSRPPAQLAAGVLAVALVAVSWWRALG